MKIDRLIENRFKHQSIQILFKIFWNNLIRSTTCDAVQNRVFRQKHLQFPHFLIIKLSDI
jgi:hypothetical protein